MYETLDVPTCIRSQRRVPSAWGVPDAPFGKWLLNSPTWSFSRLLIIEDFGRRVRSGEIFWR